MTGTHLLVTGGSLSPFVSSQNFEPAESLLSHQTVLVADTTEDPLRFSVRQAAGDVPAARFGPGHLMYHGERRGEPGEGCAGASRVGVSWCEWCGGQRGGEWESRLVVSTVGVLSVGMGRDFAGMGRLLRGGH